MLRALLRNVVVALVIGLPTLITAAVTIAWAFPPPWAGPEGIRVSVPGFVGGFTFGNVLLLLPASVFALIHQLLVAGVARRRATGTTRATSVAFALALSGCVVALLAATSTDIHWPRRSNISRDRIRGLQGSRPAVDSLCIALAARVSRDALVRLFRSAHRAEDSSGIDTNGHRHRAPFPDVGSHQ
jgi:hypothetical protein